jgi:DhnA family fructose-bisphosphate aldolase class Ia
VFQHANPTRIVRALCMLVHENARIDAVLDYLQKD